MFFCHNRPTCDFKFERNVKSIQKYVCDGVRGFANKMKYLSFIEWICFTICFIISEQYFIYYYSVLQFLVPIFRIQFNTKVKI